MKPTDIVVCYSSLSRWYEPPPLIAEEKKSHTSVKGKEKTETDRDVTTVASGSMLEGRSLHYRIFSVWVHGKLYVLASLNSILSFKVKNIF